MNATQPLPLAAKKFSELEIGKRFRLLWQGKASGLFFYYKVDDHSYGLHPGEALWDWNEEFPEATVVEVLQ